MAPLSEKMATQIEVLHRRDSTAASPNSSTRQRKRLGLPPHNIWTAWQSHRNQPRTPQRPGPGQGDYPDGGRLSSSPLRDDARRASTIGATDQGRGRPSPHARPFRTRHHGPSRRRGRWNARQFLRTASSTRARATVGTHRHTLTH